MADVIKWTLAGVLVVLGLAINYMFVDQLVYYVRIVVSTSILMGSLVVASQTSHGQRCWAFMQSSRTELRKIVWPTRQETAQVTVIVVIMVFIMSLILWGFDMALFKLMAWFTGQGV